MAVEQEGSLVAIIKFVNRDTGLSDCASERTEGNLVVFPSQRTLDLYSILVFFGSIRYFFNMKAVTEIIVESGLGDRFVTASRLDQLLDGSPQRRYGLVNRALKSGELLRLQRGLYVLADRYRSYPCHPFILAQALSPGSYISFETALAYHGWIPERVYTIASVVPGRKSRQYVHEKLGVYSFYPLAIQPGCFLELVSRVPVEKEIMLMARPCRALMDLICQRKIAWKGLSWLSEGLRIDPDLLGTITKSDIMTLELVYKQKKVKSFLAKLSLELGID